MQKFERRCLIRRTTSPHDARQSHLSLSSRGRRAYAPLERHSQRDAALMLKRLRPADRSRLMAAMQTIEGLLDNESKPPQQRAGKGYTLRAPVPGDFGWIVRRHAEIYAQEYGWTEPFEGLCAQIVADFANDYDKKRERCWIAEIDGAPVGSVFLVKQSDEVAKLRLLLVEPQARGLGIGARLVAECIRFARLTGYRTLTLWTNDVLVAARRIYQAAGFRLVAEEKHHSFGHDLVGQNWELDL